MSFQGALLRWRLRYIPLLGREIGKLGLEARLIPPVYVTPFVKRQKTDANDAEAIAGAALRPTMRYVSVKSAAQQAQAAGTRHRQQSQSFGHGIYLSANVHNG